MMERYRKLDLDIEQPLQALLISSDKKMKEDILAERKKISIRKGWRKYEKDKPIMLVCRIEPWCVTADVIKIRHCRLGEITETELRQDGFSSFGEMLDGLREYYSDINFMSKVTVVGWDNVRGKLVDESKDSSCKPKKALPGAIIVFHKDAFEGIIAKVASVSDDERSGAEVMVIKPGCYRCNSDEVVLYNHFLNDLIKCDLLEIRHKTVSEISERECELVGVKRGRMGLHDYLRRFVSEDLASDSMVTLFYCNNVRGKIIDDRIELNKFRKSISPSAKE